MLTVLKLGLILLWALWMSLVTVLNIVDALKSLGVVSPKIVFSSGNFPFLQQTTRIYRTPEWLNWTMFAGVIAWEIVASALLWWALFSGGALEAVNAAFVVSIALWGAFIVLDELFLTFTNPEADVMGTHRSLFLCFLVSLLAIHLL